MTTDAATRPKILAISLNHQPFFDEMYGSLLTKIKSKANFQRVKQLELATRLLSEQPGPTAVLITDEALSDNRNKHVWEAVLQYVRQGGIAVVMGHFPSFVKPLRIKPFFLKAGLRWERGSYHRTTLVLNRTAVDGSLAAKLPQQYSQKAVYVQNVASEDAWYITDEESVIESAVFPPTSAKVLGESPVTFASVGDGKLGYVGDVNAEEGSDYVILAMCGLLF